MESTTLHDKRYYQVVFIRMKDAPMFARYLELMAPIVRAYGGDLERMLAPQAIYADRVAKPDTVNVVFYEDRDAFAAFNRDPEFRKIAHLRAESIDMVAVGGLPVEGRVSNERLGERVYAVEIARFGPKGAAGYRAYEAEADPTMRNYGYHVERVLKPDAASGLPFTPDLVKVAYFDTPDGMDRLHNDPAHTRIERDLYPSAVAESVWVVGMVHPSTLAAAPPS